MPYNNTFLINKLSIIIYFFSIMFLLFLYILSIF